MREKTMSKQRNLSRQTKIHDFQKLHFAVQLQRSQTWHCSAQY